MTEGRRETVDAGFSGLTTAAMIPVYMNSSMDQDQLSPIFVAAANCKAVELGSIPAGFPSPAEDHGARRIDLIERLISSHPQATYVMRVRGLSMEQAGIADGDVIVIDRAITPRSGHIVVAVVDGEFTVKFLQLRAGRLKLKSANPTFADIVPKEGQTVEVWGVVKACLKEFAT